MGESGPRRSTLVSRLPIFRRSVSKRQDSLPSSPSSGGVGNGLHTSSPSSTNSSSSSTGKRRSLFRAPAIGFHGRRSGGPCADPASLSLDGRSQASELGLAAGCDSKVRHSFGFGRHRKRMSRSQTEDLEKASGNRNVFINCISSGTNEGDDSGFLDDGSSKRSSRHRKQLLPKSFSAHHRFSKNSFNVPEQGKSQEEVGEPPKTGTPGSWPGELAESSLQSPMISEDRTTAVTPSDFVHITEDSVSEVDALPAPSPAAPPQTSGHDAPTSWVCFSPGEAATEQPLLLDASHPANVQCESTAVYAEPATLQTVEEIHPEKQEAGGCEQAPEPSEESSSNPEPRERKPRNPVLIQQVGKLSGLAKLESKPRHPRKPHTGMTHGSLLQHTQEWRVLSPAVPCPSAVSMCSSSPYHDVMRMEKRLRSASEGAGGPRLHLNLREPHCLETSTLAEQRTNSSSSKMGSLVSWVRGVQRSLAGWFGGTGRHAPLGSEHHVDPFSSQSFFSKDFMLNFGSSELDEDDLMLDLELSDDQRQRHASQEDSSQSLASCLNLLPSPLEPTADQTPAKESREHNRYSSSPPLSSSFSSSSLLVFSALLNWSLYDHSISPTRYNACISSREQNSMEPRPRSLCLPRDDDPPASLEVLPFRQMQQDCTATKTLLLRLRRLLQESTETSPASSLHSLPISPCSEKSLLLKDPGREECQSLQQQLKERDELILRLQAELEVVRNAQKTLCQKADKTTQTDLAVSEVSPHYPAIRELSTAYKPRFSLRAAPRPPAAAPQRIAWKSGKSCLSSGATALIPVPGLSASDTRPWNNSTQRRPVNFSWPGRPRVWPRQRRVSGGLQRRVAGHKPRTPASPSSRAVRAGVAGAPWRLLPSRPTALQRRSCLAYGTRLVPALLPPRSSVCRAALPRVDHVACASGSEPSHSLSLTLSSPLRHPLSSPSILPSPFPVPFPTPTPVPMPLAPASLPVEPPSFVRTPPDSPSPSSSVPVTLSPSFLSAVHLLPFVSVCSSIYPASRLLASSGLSRSVMALFRTSPLSATQRRRRTFSSAGEGPGGRPTGGAVRPGAESRAGRESASSPPSILSVAVNPPGALQLSTEGLGGGRLQSPGQPSGPQPSGLQTARSPARRSLDARPRCLSDIWETATHPSRAASQGCGSLARDRRPCGRGGEAPSGLGTGAGPREPPPASQIPRAAAGSSSGRGSPSRSLSSDGERGPGARSDRGPLPRLHSSFTGRLGQPPRGPLSLHVYSRKNVFLQHSLQTAELQALAQQDG
ncbi:hypothetical protein P4O66_022948 [Electrophorus voltai]|uniref:Coiled-coil serine-rich protein 1 n=1 Tax=Electrophorus voltai TaxID=2609070 RepID=A0AAD9E1V0_9TELE|nr:hypothetical protein P4O66_022948 [Electrophorus voltai]